MQIYLRAQNGSTFDIEVESTDTYKDVVTKLNKVVDGESKKARLANERHHINPLITTNPKIFFPEINKHFNEGMRLMDIGVQKDMVANFFDNWGENAELRPANSTWVSGMDEAKFEEYKELKKIIEINKKKIGADVLDRAGEMGHDVISQRQNEELERQIKELQDQVERKQGELNQVELKRKIEADEREEAANEQARNDYYSGNHDHIVGLRGGGRRKGRKSKTKRKGSRRKGSRRKGSGRKGSGRKGSRRGRKSRRTRGR